MYTKLFITAVFLVFGSPATVFADLDSPGAVILLLFS
jgi:hypothetical protein